MIAFGFICLFPITTVCIYILGKKEEKRRTKKKKEEKKKKKKSQAVDFCLCQLTRKSLFIVQS